MDGAPGRPAHSGPLYHSHHPHRAHERAASWVVFLGHRPANRRLGRRLDSRQPEDRRDTLATKTWGYTKPFVRFENRSYWEQARLSTPQLPPCSKRNFHLASFETIGPKKSSRDSKSLDLHVWAVGLALLEMLHKARMESRSRINAQSIAAILTCVKLLIVRKNLQDLHNKR